ncbi:MAG TPA: cytochrome c [Candidatus Acidoferrales bacterium]|nr:cytochrome c [Candidatus Acidoferrales bacterium]
MNGTTRIEGKSFQRCATLAASFILAGAMAAVVAGCGSGSGPQAASRSDASAGGEPAATASNAAAAPAAREDKGKEFFTQSCSNCHGMNGQGVPHLGADLQTSKFVGKSTDTQLVSLIEHGIPANDPRNTSHIPMPPKGANPSLTRQDIQGIVLYLRELQKEQGKAK